MMSKVYPILCCVRILLVLSPQTGYIHPDEHFQGPEVVYGDVLQLKVHKTWEFTSQKPIRNIVYPYLVTGFPSLITDLLKANLWGTVSYPYLLLILPRIVMCCFSFIHDILLYKLCLLMKKDHEPPLILFASSYVTLVYLTRTFSNSLESLFFSFMIYFICRLLQAKEVSCHQSPSVNHVQSCANICYMLGLVLGIGVFNRPTFMCYAAFPITIFFILLFSMKINAKSFLTYFLSFYWGGVSVLFSFSAIDTLYYKEVHYSSISDIHQDIVVTPINFIRYNTDVSNLDHHGLHSRWLHLCVNVPLLFSIYGVLIIIKFFTSAFNLFILPHLDFKNVLVFSFTAPPVLLSFIPHHEPIFCFLFSIFNLLSGIVFFISVRQLYKESQLDFKRVVLLSFTIPLLWFSLIPQEEPRFTLFFCIFRVLTLNAFFISACSSFQLPHLDFNSVVLFFRSPCSLFKLALFISDNIRVLLSMVPLFMAPYLPNKEPKCLDWFSLYILSTLFLFIGLCVSKLPMDTTNTTTDSHTPPHSCFENVLLFFYNLFKLSHWKHENIQALIPMMCLLLFFFIPNKETGCRDTSSICGVLTVILLIAVYIYSIPVDTNNATTVSHEPYLSIKNILSFLRSVCNLLNLSFKNVLLFFRSEYNLFDQSHLGSDIVMVLLSMVILLLFFLIPYTETGCRDMFSICGVLMVLVLITAWTNNLPVVINNTPTDSHEPSYLGFKNVLSSLRSECSLFQLPHLGFKNVLLLSFMTPLLLLSLVPHQEPRFILPLVFPLVLMYDDSFCGKYVNKKVLRKLWYAQNVIAVLFFGFFHQGGIYTSTSHIHSVIRNDTRSSIIYYKTYMPPRHLLGLELTRKDVQVYDFAGIDLVTLDSYLEKMKMLSRPQVLFVVVPHEIVNPIINLPSVVLDYKFFKRKYIFPHLSMESLPDLKKMLTAVKSNSSIVNKLLEIKKSFSIHILMFKSIL